MIRNTDLQPKRQNRGETILVSEEMQPPRSRAVPLPAAIGHLAAEVVTPYPPGVPLLVPGERIGWNKLMYLARVVASGAFCAGAADPHLLTIRIIDEEA